MPGVTMQAVDPALHPDRPGAALLEGWSDSGPRRIVLPWPEETRTLPWSAAADWKQFLSSLENEILGEETGCWVGFISYEALASEEEVAPRDAHPPEPAAFFARHRVGPVERRALSPPSVHRRAESPPLHRIVDSLGNGAHARAVARIREAIRDGDVYQVNLTRAYTAACGGDPAGLYRALTGSRPPRSSAFLRGPGWTIVSASPEVLLEFDRVRGVADSRPIKGTVRRAGDERSEIAALLASDKDAAEHLMIVDVVRNDFGKIAPPGSVSVADFRSVRTLEHVHHLESTVRATGLRDVSTADVLAALSPAASITGAPKRAAVHMIRDIEPVARGVYCGAIGTIRPDGATFSVAIRTAVVTETSMRYHAGGGIVWDSDAHAEDDECRAKSAAFLDYVGAGE